MKVALGQKIQSGPWGGGNRFVSALANALAARGDQVVYGLEADDIDVILMVDPRARNPNLAFTPGQVFRYLLRHPRALVLHRINECDERKGTRTMNFRLRAANYVADHTVFIGSWLKDLAVWRNNGEHSVILNGADARIFNRDGHVAWPGQGRLELVTHHWGAHAFKGFDVYERLDAMLASDAWSKRLAFTYIGNLPSGFRFQRVQHLEPMDASELASALRRHHAYVSASINEPAGMHHIEGALCGLPLLYRNSGALPEYCKGFGEMFKGAPDIEGAVQRLMSNFPAHMDAISRYPWTAARMCDAYLSLLDGMVAKRKELLARRRLWLNPVGAMLIQLPL